MTPRQCRHNEAKEIQEKGENVAPLHPLIAAHPLCAPKRFWRLTIITTCLFWCLTSHYLQNPHLGSPHSLLIFLGNYSRHILAFLGLTSHKRELLLSNFRLFFGRHSGFVFKRIPSTLCCTLTPNFQANNNTRLEINTLES